jgi:GNAT superfamily N-acetyltransferase
MSVGHIDQCAEAAAVDRNSISTFGGALGRSRGRSRQHDRPGSGRRHAHGFRTDEVVGIHNVATIESARGRGYGTAMTWATIADAEPGVRVAVLKASALGRPVYERMGFRAVVEYEELEGSTAAPPDRPRTA